MLQHPMTTHKDLRTLLLCALYAFVLLFFLSPDSYLRDIFYRCDSAIFFMCGKAWMNGMTPYVDFADSKGPLLWLIYGLGYLLNHHSYVGVFWISILFYTATLYIAYKLCRLFLEPRPSALCVALLPFALFYRWVNSEIRAEDFCYPFIMFCFYALCRIIKEETLLKRTYIWLCAGIGICFMACLLMKWNVAAMIGGPMLCVFILSFKHKVWGICIGSMIAGAVVLALPFFIYFLAFADFSTFIQEYFVNTYLTMEGRTSILDTLTFDQYMLTKERPTIVLLVCMLIFCWRYKRYAWLIVCYFIFRIGMGRASIYYYFSILTPFFIFFLLAAIDFFYSRWPKIIHRLTPGCCLLAAIMIGLYHIRAVNYSSSIAAQERQKYYEAAYVMSQVKKPRIMNFNQETGKGTPVDALPACRYWTGQNGMTEEMRIQREQAVRDRIPDFVVVVAGSKDVNAGARVMAAGYIPYVHSISHYKEDTFTLYGRPGLQLPPKDFHVSQWDIWLKRNIFGI